MKRTFLIGVAAGALLAGANIASAQTMERSTGGAATEQKGGSGAEQRGRAGETKAQAPAGDIKAQGQAQGDMKASSGQSQPKQDAQKQDAQKQDAQKSDSKAQQGQRAQDAQSKPDASKSGAAAQGEKSGTTSGQGAAGGAKASLSTEQRTKIRDTVIRSGNAPRVSNVNFSVSVGTVVPRTVRYAPLPPVLVEVYPQWRGYHYIIVEEQIVIIEPSSFKIVTIITV